MKQEDFCSYEIAKLLKDKGFDEPFFFFYRTDDEVKNIHHAYEAKPLSYHQEYIDDDVVNAPTHQMAMKWLREVHNIFIEISTSIDLNGNYHFSYIILDKECKYVRRGYTDFDWKYEEAVEAALKYSLENLI